VLIREISLRFNDCNQYTNTSHFLFEGICAPISSTSFYSRNC